MIRLSSIYRILGILLMFFSISMLPPILVSLWYGEHNQHPFGTAFIITFGSGLLLWLQFRHESKELKPRDGFLVVVLLWLVLGFYGAIPFLLDTTMHISFTDAMFESVSGLTTTGASVLEKLYRFPRSLLYYRQQLQFLGGMGIIVLAVAVLPMLGVGGMQLFQAETPGPMKESKLTPRITSTAKALWYIYVSLVAACGVCYWFAGMTPFEAIGESFSTVATGGFALHDDSFAYYHSESIDIIGMTFMILGATNFALHFTAFQQHTLRHYWRDSEFRAFLFIMFIVIIIVSLALISNHIYSSVESAILKSAFAVVSLATTTGFVDGQFALWPTFVPMIIMMTAIIGGCAASTGGGLKVIRMLLLYKQGNREIHRLIHPRAILPIKFGRQVLPDQILQTMWGFIAVFFVVFGFLILMLMATGADMPTSFSAVAACLSNAGAGIGAVKDNFQSITISGKWILTIAMLAGRLEIFTILVLFSPTYWRQ